MDNGTIGGFSLEDLEAAALAGLDGGTSDGGKTNPPENSAKQKPVWEGEAADLGTSIGAAPVSGGFTGGNSGTPVGGGFTGSAPAGNGFSGSAPAGGSFDGGFTGSAPASGGFSGDPSMGGTGIGTDDGVGDMDLSGVFKKDFDTQQFNGGQSTLVSSGSAHVGGGFFGGTGSAPADGSFGGGFSGNAPAGDGFSGSPSMGGAGIGTDDGIGDMDLSGVFKKDSDTQQFNGDQSTSVGTGSAPVGGGFFGGTGSAPADGSFGGGFTGSAPAGGGISGGTSTGSGTFVGGGFSGMGNAADSNAGSSIGTGKAADPDAVYTFGGIRLVNVTNRLAGIYEEKLLQAADLIDAGRTAEALQLTEEVKNNNISSEVAWWFYAYALESWGEKQTAIKAYEQSIAINPRFAVAYNDLGLLYAELENAEAASQCLNKALECDPTNSKYMGLVAHITTVTDCYNAGIEKCKHFIEIADDKTFPQNMLGRLYVNLSKEYVVEVPNDFTNAEAGTTPGFISLEDIQEVRRLCNEAKPLLTLDSFKEDAEMAEVLLQACDNDCQLVPAYNSLYVTIHAVVACLIYTFVTLIWGLPIGIFAAIMTKKANYFPRYMLNYAWCTGSDDPLKYNRDSFYSNHEILAAMADGAKESWDSTDSSTSSWGEIGGALLKTQFWFLKARIHFYKSFFQQRKELKKQSAGIIGGNISKPQA